jgi:hypothetical protein
MCPDEFFTGATASHKLVNFFNSAVKNRNRETFTLHVQYQVFAHNGEADKANVC